MILQTYAGILLERYRESHEISDLELSISMAREAARVTSKGHVDRAIYLLRIAEGLGKRFNRIHSTDDLKEAIDVSRSALEAVGPDVELRGAGLFMLGTHLLLLDKRTKDEAHEEEALKSLRLPLDLTQSLPGTRIRAERTLTLQYILKEMWADAFDASQTVFKLIPSLVVRSLENSDKEHILGDIGGGLSVDCATLTLQSGESASTALAFLQMGRGVMATSLEDLATDVGKVELEHPSLPIRFTKLRDELRGFEDSTWRGQNESPSASWTFDRNRRRREADEEFEDILVDIRRQQGFEVFLTAPQESEIIAAAEKNPIVVVNSSIFRCDAMIIQNGETMSISLPDFKRADLWKHLHTATLGTSQALEWFWDSIAKPVLEKLGYICPPAGHVWPCVFWIMPGLMSQVPIHAAAYHKDGSSRIVLDLVISSYHISVRSLVQSRRQPILVRPLLHAQWPRKRQGSPRCHGSYARTSPSPFHFKRDFGSTRNLPEAVTYPRQPRTQQGRCLEASVRVYHLPFCRARICQSQSSSRKLPGLGRGRADVRDRRKRSWHEPSQVSADAGLPVRLWYWPGPE